MHIYSSGSFTEKLTCCQREVGPTAFHSSTMKLFLLGGTLRSDLLCTRWLSPKGPKSSGIIRIPDVAGYCRSGVMRLPFSSCQVCIQLLTLNSEMLDGMLLIHLITFILDFDPPNRHYAVQILRLLAIKYHAVRIVCPRTTLVNI